ncbi:MAG TPA: hypothetical protein VLF67_00140 [Candidatus Saccharimonas sp.]|nr:hypothetical protein [Candidatus Saccharimonas sp.]
MDYYISLGTIRALPPANRWTYVLRLIGLNLLWALGGFVAIAALMRFMANDTRFGAVLAESALLTAVMMVYIVKMTIDSAWIKRYRAAVQAEQAKTHEPQHITAYILGVEPGDGHWTIDTIDGDGPVQRFDIPVDGLEVRSGGRPMVAFVCDQFEPPTAARDDAALTWGGHTILTLPHPDQPPPLRAHPNEYWSALTAK